MQLDPKGLEAARQYCSSLGGNRALQLAFAEVAEHAILTYLEIAPSPSPAPGVVETPEAAYAAGFANSAEGYNAEYPFDGDFEGDPSWSHRRDENVQRIIASHAQGGDGGVE